MDIMSQSKPEPIVSWWALPSVQQTRGNFALVADVEAISMRAKNFTTADYIDAHARNNGWGYKRPTEPQS